MAKRRLNRAAWTEGLFLRPHHLQHLDVSAEERLLYHVRSANPFQYGLRSLALDEEALTDQRIVIQRLEAVLPGGQIINYPGNASVESRKFDPVERLDIYVGIRQTNPHEANSVPEGEDPRNVPYVRHAEQMPDMHRPDAESPVELLLPNVRVFISGEEDDVEVYDSFKLAEIHATGDSANPFTLTTTYVPPLLAIQAWKTLCDDIEKLVNRMAGKVRVVASGKGSLTALDVRRILMWYTLARQTPLLRHHLSTGQTHPFDLCSLLVETAAAIGSMNRDELVELPSYDHEDLYNCIQGLIDFINGELETEFRDRSTEFKMPLDRRRWIYATAEELSREMASSRNAFYLAVKADLDSAELAKLVVTRARRAPPRA